MAYTSKQIGHRAEYYILHDILKQLERLTQVISNAITTTTSTTAA